jgi:hypothetical protein
VLSNSFWIREHSTSAECTSGEYRQAVDLGEDVVGGLGSGAGFGSALCSSVDGSPERASASKPVSVDDRFKDAASDATRGGVLDDVCFDQPRELRASARRGSGGAIPDRPAVPPLVPTPTLNYHSAQTTLRGWFAHCGSILIFCFSTKG